MIRRLYNSDAMWSLPKSQMFTIQLFIDKIWQPLFQMTQSLLDMSKDYIPSFFFLPKPCSLSEWHYSHMYVNLNFSAPACTTFLPVSGLSFSCQFLSILKSTYYCLCILLSSSSSIMSPCHCSLCPPCPLLPLTWVLESPFLRKSWPFNHD